MCSGSHRQVKENRRKWENGGKNERIKSSEPSPFTYKTLGCWVAWKASCLFPETRNPPESGIHSNGIHKSHGAAFGGGRARLSLWQDKRLQSLEGKDNNNSNKLYPFPAFPGLLPLLCKLRNTQDKCLALHHFICSDSSSQITKYKPRSQRTVVPQKCQGAQGIWEAPGNPMENQVSPSTAQLLLSHCLCLGRISPADPQHLPGWGWRRNILPP